MMAFPFTKIANVGVALVLIWVVTLLLGVAAHAPVTGFV